MLHKRAIFQPISFEGTSGGEADLTCHGQLVETAAATGNTTAWSDESKQHQHDRDFEAVFKGGPVCRFDDIL
jgi:hypothetical protein